HTQRAAVKNLYEADDTARLVAGLRGPIENLPCMGIRSERLALDDSDCRQHAQPIGTGEIVAFAIHEELELIECAAIANRQHVNWDARSVGESHRFGASLAIQRVDFRLFKVRHSRSQILRVLI